MMRLHEWNERRIEEMAKRMGVEREEALKRVFSETGETIDAWVPEEFKWKNRPRGEKYSEVVGKNTMVL